MSEASLFVIVCGIVFWSLTALCLVDILLKDFGSLKNKAIWFVVASVPVIGWLVYLIFGFRKGVRKKNQD